MDRKRREESAIKDRIKEKQNEKSEGMERVVLTRARGIAVFADENRSRQRLTHYFDISDTHESRYSRTVPIWDMVLEEGSSAPG